MPVHHNMELPVGLSSSVFIPFPSPFGKCRPGFVLWRHRAFESTQIIVLVTVLLNTHQPLALS